MSRRSRSLLMVAAALSLTAGRAGAQAGGRARAPAERVTAAPPSVPPSTRSTDSAGRLYAPGMVQSRDRGSVRDNDVTVKEIEGKIHCTCGCNLDVFTCRTTDFNCATSPAMHRQVLARMDSGMTAEQIVTAFEAQYGQAVLMAPPRRGFNWAAYVMPFVGLAAGLGIVILVMRKWIRARPRTPIEGEAVALESPVAGEEIERLKRELERFEA
ncbi:MAG: cytochrome c-type biogenesis protein CcmH [Gemmatimonadales bacterium]|nr:cytochrome c-type biogenesis protein CcmH [Gemmatimonadales bacterium]